MLCRGLSSHMLHFADKATRARRLESNALYPRRVPQDAPGAFRDERAFSEPRTMEGFANDLTPNHEEFKDRGALPPQPFSMIARDRILSRDEVRPGTQKV